MFYIHFNFLPSAPWNHHVLVTAYGFSNFDDPLCFERIFLGASVFFLSIATELPAQLRGCARDHAQNNGACHLAFSRTKVFLHCISPNSAPSMLRPMRRTHGRGWTYLPEF